MRELTTQQRYDRARVRDGRNVRRMRRRTAQRLGISLEQYERLTSIRTALRAELRAISLLKKQSTSRECALCGAAFSVPLSRRRKYCDTPSCVKRRHSDSVLKLYRKNGHYRDQTLERAHTRRAERLGLGGLSVTIDYLLERDSWRCGICGEKIRDRKDASLDHIVPLAGGGEHVIENVQSAHRFCNYSKGARGGNEQLRMVG